MQIGALVYATDQGLGYLARDFFEHGVFDRALVEPHFRRPDHPEWYPEAQRYTPAQADAFLDGLGALLLFEQTKLWPLVEEARARGIPVILMPMHECTPEPLPVSVDGCLCPSVQDYYRFTHRYPSREVTVPADVPWRQRRRARVFVHNAGNARSAIRNGLLEVLAAIALVRSPARFIIRRQEEYSDSDFLQAQQPMLDALLKQAAADPRVTLVTGKVPFAELWQEGDAFVFPEACNGLSLPLQEAFASGMLVLATDRFPNNHWLPREPLIRTERLILREDWKVPFKHAEVSPLAIASAIDRWYDVDITEYSLAGRDWARRNSWRRWRPRYRKLIAELAAASPSWRAIEAGIMGSESGVRVKDSDP